MKEQQIKKVYKDGKQYAKAYLNGQLIWSVMERPQDDNEEYLNVFDIEIPRAFYPCQDIVLHNLFGVHMKTEVNGQVIYDDDQEVHAMRLPVALEGTTKYHIRTNGYINPDFQAPSRLFVTRIDKISLPQINDIPEDKQDLLRTYSPILFGMKNLRYVNLSHLDLSNCARANWMFSGLNGLVNYKKLGYDKCEIVGADLTEFYAPESIYSMFSHSRIHMDNFNWINTKNVKNMSCCFRKYDTTGIEELHLENWDTHNVLYAEDMFSGLHDIVILVGGNWTLDTSSTAYGGKNLTIIVGNSTK